MKEIRLENQLGIAVRSWIDKTFKGKVAPAKIPNAYNYNTTFSEEEIAVAATKMTTLDVKDINEATINQLYMFPNVKYLSLTSTSIMQLPQKTLQTLESMPNLAEVAIKGYKGFTSFDIGAFQNLNSLILVNNPDLETIKNLSPDLYVLECYGNQKLKNYKEVVYTALEIASNNGTCKIDACHAPIALKKMADYKTRYEDIPNRICFGDVVQSYDMLGHPGDAIELSHTYDEIRALNEKVKTISSSTIKPEDTTEQKFAALYGWVCKNIKYDFVGLKNDGKHFYGSSTFNGKETSLRNGLAKGTNSFVNGIIYGECVCEGYAKALHYMCNYHNIKTSLIHCEIHREGKKPEYHAILRYDEPPVRYCDPTWDASAYQSGDNSLKYFMRTEEEIGKTHSRIKAFKDVRPTNADIDRESLTRRAFDC